MLVQARRVGESIVIADIIEVKVLSVTGQIVRLGISAPKEIPVRRVDSKTQVSKLPDKS